MRWRPFGLLAAAGGVVMLGVASSLLSAGACERSIAAPIVARGREVYVVADGRQSIEDTERILHRAGARTRRCTDTGARFTCYPWAQISTARVVFPFVARVDWGVMWAPLWGYGGTTWFVSALGLVFELGTFPRWIS